MEQTSTEPVVIRTPSGRPLLRSGDDVFTSSGLHVARFDGDVAYAPSGRYVGTFEEDRLVYMQEDRDRTGSMFVRESHVGFTPDDWRDAQLDREPVLEE